MSIKGKLLVVVMALLLLVSSMPMMAASAAWYPSTKVEKKALVRTVKFKKTKGTVKLKPTRDNQYNIGKYAYASPVSADNRVLSWSVDKPNLADVDENGIVTVRNEGKVKITARSTDGSNKRASFSLTIKATRVSKITLGSSLETIDIGGDYQMAHAVKPTTASYQEVRYDSVDSSIATVDANGRVVGVSPGVTTVYARTDTVKKQKYAKMTVRVRTKNPTRISVSAVGDVIPGGDPDRGTRKTFEKYLKAYGAETGSIYTGMLINAIPYFSGDDVTIANLECALVNGGARGSRRKYSFKGKPDWANVLKYSSIEIANLANNHTHDYGGYTSTKRALKAAGVGYNGFNYGERTIKEINGIRVGFIGFQTGPYDASAYTIRRDVGKLKKLCDVVVVSLHFGDWKEYQRKVPAKAKSYARNAINAGATLVLGHHPHVLSGFESYKGGLIAYGLGSFQQVGTNPSLARRTIIFQTTINVHEGFQEHTDIKAIPFWISSTNKVNDMRPTQQYGDEANEIKKIIDRYSVGTKVNYEFPS